MEENSNIEAQINELLAQINEFNNGNDELVYVVEGVLKAVSKYAKKTSSYYIKFRLMELYLDLSLRIVNNAIRKSDEYQRLHQYYEEDLAFYLEAATTLKTYIKKCEKTGDVDNLDSAYLMTIYLSTILSNLSDYVSEINKITGDMVGNFSYRADEHMRERTKLDIEEIKALMKNLEEEGK